MRYAFMMPLQDEAVEIAPEELERRREQMRRWMPGLEFVDTPEDMPEIHVENMPEHKTDRYYRHILNGVRKFVSEGGCANGASRS